MTVRFQTKKRALVSSYITWASSKENQAMANNFWKIKHQAHLNNYNDLLQSWVCLTITERNNTRHAVGAGAHEDRQGRERRSDHQHIVCCRYRRSFSRIIFFPLKYLSYIAKCITDKFKKLTFLHLRFMFLAYYQTRLRCIEFFHWHLYLFSSIKCLHFGFCLISRIYQPFWNFYKV